MNHGNDMPAYGLWSLVFINSAVFYSFRFQLLQAGLEARLADFRWLLGFHRRALR